MKNRNVSVDLFRFLAALSIMFLHTCWGLDDSLLDAYPIIGLSLDDIRSFYSLRYRDIIVFCRFQRDAMQQRHRYAVF